MGKKKVIQKLDSEKDGISEREAYAIEAEFLEVFMYYEIIIETNGVSEEEVARLKKLKADFYIALNCAKSRYKVKRKFVINIGKLFSIEFGIINKAEE